VLLREIIVCKAKLAKGSTFESVLGYLALQGTDIALTKFKWTELTNFIIHIKI